MPRKPVCLIGSRHKPHGVLVVDPTPAQPGVRCDLNACTCRVAFAVWVSHALRAVFYEIPKAASSSIKTALDFGHVPPPAYARRLAQAMVEGDGEMDIRIQDPALAPFAQAFVGAVRGQARKIRAGEPEIFPPYGRFGFTMAALAPVEAWRRWPGYLHFAVYRSPAERLFSTFRMFQRPEMIEHAEHHFGASGDTLDWAAFMNGVAKSRDHHWEEAAAYLPLDEDGKPQLDMLLRMESLAEDWARLAERLGLDVALPMKNAAPTRAKPPMTEDMERIVRKEFARDLALFG